MSCNHRPKDNKLGVTWCIDCGKLFTKSSGKKLTAVRRNGVFSSKHVLIASLALLTLVGCDISKRYEKVRQKVLKKGTVIPKDTLYITKSDTVTAYFMRNDTVVERITITDTVTLEPTVEVKTRWQTRIEYRTVKEENKTAIDSLKQLLRIEKQQTKQTRIEHRGLSIWWLILIIGVFILYLLITNRR